jgi:hypothetical protein
MYIMADAMFMYAATTGFFIGLVAILFGMRARRNSRSTSASVTSGSGTVVGNT